MKFILIMLSGGGDKVGLCVCYVSKALEAGKNGTEKMVNINDLKYAGSDIAAL